MGDDARPAWNLSIDREAAEKIDFSQPVTRHELMQVVLKTHEALLAQSQIVALVAGYSQHIPRDMVMQMVKDTGDVISLTETLLKDWSGAVGG